jgi:phosphatidylethanolamine-binding protein (PEBP) family uncharacterized protein
VKPALVGVLLFGCSYRLDVAPCTIACTASEECPDGLECTSGFCGASSCPMSGDGGSDGDAAAADAVSGGVAADAAKPIDRASDLAAAPADAAAKLDSPAPVVGISVGSGDVRFNQPIPSVHGCDSASPVSPDLSWADGPGTTRAYAVIIGQRLVDEWVVWDIPAVRRSLPHAVPPGATLADPAGAHQMNVAMQPAYYGACPPAGTTQTVFFTVFAVNVYPLPNVTTSSKITVVVGELQKHKVAQGQFTAPYTHH